MVVGDNVLPTQHSMKYVQIHTVDEHYLLLFAFFCSDGVGRTGTFICIHSQMERLKTEGVVDFFQAAKSACIQRAGLIPDDVCIIIGVLKITTNFNLFLFFKTLILVQSPLSFYFVDRLTMPSATRL